MNYLSLACLFSGLCACAVAYPYAFPEDPYHVPEPVYKPEPSYHEPVHHGYGKPEIGRVKIQVYRGPSELKGKHGYEPIYFAPWGYYVTQPQDAKPHKYGYH